LVERIGDERDTVEGVVTGADAGEVDAGVTELVRDPHVGGAAGEDAD
jgi:hypothetical protein